MTGQHYVDSKVSKSSGCKETLTQPKLCARDPPDLDQFLSIAGIPRLSFDAPHEGSMQVCTSYTREHHIGNKHNNISKPIPYLPHAVSSRRPDKVVPHRLQCSCEARSKHWEETCQSISMPSAWSVLEVSPATELMIHSLLEASLFDSLAFHASSKLEVHEAKFV